MQVDRGRKLAGLCWITVRLDRSGSPPRTEAGEGPFPRVEGQHTEFWFVSWPTGFSFVWYVMSTTHSAAYTAMCSWLWREGAAMWWRPCSAILRLWGRFVKWLSTVFFQGFTEGFPCKEKRARCGFDSSKACQFAFLGRGTG